MTTDSAQTSCSESPQEKESSHRQPLSDTETVPSSSYVVISLRGDSIRDERSPSDDGPSSGMGTLSATGSSIEDSPAQSSATLAATEGINSMGQNDEPCTPCWIPDWETIKTGLLPTSKQARQVLLTTIVLALGTITLEAVLLHRHQVLIRSLMQEPSSFEITSFRPLTVYYSIFIFAEIFALGLLWDSIATLTDKDWQKGLVEVAFAIPLSGVIILLGYYSMRHENKVTMGGFITCLGLLIAYMTFRLVSLYQTMTGNPDTDIYFYSRKTMTVFAVLTLLMTQLALIYAIVMLYNFNKGLKEASNETIPRPTFRNHSFNYSFGSSRICPGAKIKEDDRRMRRCHSTPYSKLQEILQTEFDAL
ncbi:hypothetical protein BGX28_006110 [Mortierella sp. GBA30]|nr:hypothetical protein BGX28_006110 [Mortierella sp. GBA30]